jgi:transcriptional regulator
VKELVKRCGWATLVSVRPGGGGVIASHYPVIVDDAAEAELVLLGHMCQPDAEAHALGTQELLVIVEGPHGYISPGWYGPGPAVPTWNFLTAHLYGVPELLSPQANLDALDALVAHFEGVVPRPHMMRATSADAEYSTRTAGGTVGFRLRVARWTLRVKMSQDKPPRTVARIIAGLETGGPYANPPLAAVMRGVHGLPPAPPRPPNPANRPNPREAGPERSRRSAHPAPSPEDPSGIVHQENTP